MSAESSRAFKMVLSPPAILLFFLGVVATPIGAALHLLVSPNAGWIFASVAIGYYLTYEWLHFAYHLPPEGFVGRRRLIAVLRRHHQRHHDPGLMSRFNFNITFPIA